MIRKYSSEGARKIKAAQQNGLQLPASISTEATGPGPLNGSIEVLRWGRQRQSPRMGDTQSPT